MRKIEDTALSVWAEMQKEEIAAWVEKTLKAAKISYASASRRMGLPSDAISKVIRHDRDLSASEMAQISEMAASPVPTGSLETVGQPRYVRVTGEVAAGLWTDVTGQEFEEYTLLALVDKRWPPGAVFACRVKGESINLKAADGDHVVALLLDHAPRELRNGDWVIVDRQRHDLRERTVKRAKQNPDGEWELWPHSSDPRHKTPLLLGEHESESVQVVAFVLEFVTPATRF